MAICTRAATSVFRWKARAISSKLSATSSEMRCANLVTRAEDWPWSSLRRLEREDPAFPILSAWPLPKPSDWLELVNQPQSEAELDALRRAVRRSCPFGSAVWTAETAKQLKIESTLHSLGRPRKEE